MTPLGEKLIELMRPSCGNRSCCFFAPDIPPLKLNNLRETTRCPSTEEIYVLLDNTIFGSAKEGQLYCESGIYVTSMRIVEFYSWRELYQMFNEYHEWAGFCCGVGKANVKKNGKIAPVIFLYGKKFWPEFFDFYAQYSDSAEVPAKPAIDGRKVCEYCGKKFDASQDTCPGCGAPA